MSIRFTHKHLYPVLLIAFCLSVVTFAAYWQIPGFDFVDYDDNAYVSENPYIHKGLTKESIAWAFTTTYANFWHPLTWLSLMLDYQLFGPGPFGHHVMSLILHAVNTLLLLGCFRRLTGRLWQSAFVSALFALHPLHVESVAWIAQRKDVLSAFFWILAMWSYGRYVSRPTIYGYLTVCVWFVLGLVAKPMVVTLPFVLLLLDCWPLHRFNLGKQDLQRRLPHLLLEKVPLLVLTTLACGMAFYAQKSGGAIVSVETLSLQARLANALLSYVSYIWKMLWPGNLSVFYPWPSHMPMWQVIGAGSVLSAISLYAILTIKNHPYFIVGWLWYLGTLVPVIGIIKVGEFAMADRYTYLPLIGLFIIIAWGVPHLMTRWQKKKACLVIPVVVVLSFLGWNVWRQTGYWKNGITLFKHALAVTKENHVAHNNLAVLFMRQGKLHEAEGHLNEALEIKPDSDEVHTNMGTVLSRQGAFDKALAHYYQALEINPENSDAHYNLGGIFAGQGKFSPAVSHYRKATNIIPHDWKAHYRLAECLIQTGSMKAAIHHLQTTLRLNPNHTSAKKNLAKLYDMQEELGQRISQIRKAIEREPENYELYLRLGDFLGGNGNFDEAIQCYNKVLSMQPNHKESLYGLAITHTHKKEYDKALLNFKRLLVLNPEQADLYFNMSCVYAKQNKLKESISWLKKALQKGYNNWDLIKSDEDLDSIRKTIEYKEIVKGHSFPE